jgi:hypothetical protein
MTAASGGNTNPVWLPIVKREILERWLRNRELSDWLRNRILAYMDREYPLHDYDPQS